ncbi:hypothetical protein [Bacillus sinesaloumensis]|uniref:hypothetical protein n=1 Tax=Litchfieldia sinesaloumensis TaxID=1926280 RepID=UPI00098855AD|nr:hypothetical protein [Bacillus sinesaloumensis]
MSKKEIFWGSICLIVVVMAYIVPYVFLSDVAVWYGSFLLWVVLGLIIIVINYILTRNWR